jgi:hypothetical protein
MRALLKLITSRDPQTPTDLLDYAARHAPLQCCVVRRH